MNTQTSKGGFDDVFFWFQIVSLVILMIVLSSNVLFVITA
jgi:hypothetical protein